VKSQLFVVATLVVFSGSSVSRDIPKPDPAKDAMRLRIANYLEKCQAGVFYSEEKDLADGRFTRLFIVGTSPISTSLGVEDGLELAREKAEESAKEQFVKFLESKVTVRKTVKNEVLITKEGTDGGENPGVRENAKKVERRTKEFEETASGLVRGLKVVGSQQFGKEKKFVIVYRWDAKTADAIGRINEPLPKEVPKKAEPSKDKTIPDKKVIIDE
jgi:hypothetical protein